MPPFTFRSAGRSRRFLFLLVIAFAAGVVFGVRQLGRFMSPEDPLVRADAIFVLAGTRIERPMEAADLYREGYAPRILLTRDLVEPAYVAAAQRGVQVPTDLDVSKNVLEQLGVPDDAMIVPERVHDNTAQEAETLREVAMRNGWHRVIVVSSKYHLRRVSFALRRALRDTGIEIVLRGSRYDLALPDYWWRKRRDIRWMMSEVPKLVGYALGVGA